MAARFTYRTEIVVFKASRFLRLFAVIVAILSCDQHLKGEPPLHRAAYKGDVHKLKSLIADGASVNGLNSEGATPLHWAAFKGQVEAGSILLKYGADVNALTKKGSTPLRLATTHKQKEMIALLKAYGAEP